MGRPKKVKTTEIPKPVVDEHIITNYDPTPEPEPTIKPVEKKYIKDRISIVSSQDVAYIGYIELKKDVPQVIAYYILENLKDKLPTFRQLIDNGTIRVI